MASEIPDNTANPQKVIRTPADEFKVLCASLGVVPEGISSLAQLSEVAKSLTAKDSTRPPWIFRAEKMGGNLQTTLERATLGFFPDLRSGGGVESKLLREFKRRAHHYLSDLPREGDTLQWLAMMQHYGAPTRLMDWTYSPFVALSFAVTRPASGNSGYVIWAIDPYAVRTTANYELKVDDPENNDVMAQFGENDEDRFDNLFRQTEAWDTLEPLVYPVNPFRLNPRLTIQQGLFLCARQMHLSFVDNLKALKPNASGLKAYEIRRESRLEILLELDRMNLNNATLFPGLQGFAESLWTKPICYVPDLVGVDHIR